MQFLADVTAGVAYYLSPHVEEPFLRDSGNSGLYQFCLYYIPSRKMDGEMK
ncbi:MAG: hypothetical protein NZ480_07830 [Bdellovibrionaceae bacterium]|nr:hypothetical protein [Pseudobdellovibrionaceae bacterium]MDW8189503.1 hypothetical protein [Pseudobdellovibrionaceae bacterium]